jgi:hypothetical protein
LFKLLLDLGSVERREAESERRKKRHFMKGRVLPLESIGMEHRLRKRNAKKHRSRKKKRGTQT